MKKVLLILVAAFAVQVNIAQEKKLKDSPIDFSVDLKSNHLWRGLVITDKPMVAVFTSIKLNKSGSFTTGFWGGMSFSNESDGTSYKEINYYVQYAKNGFSIGLWDLFNTRGVDSPDVWNYDKETTGHILDLRTSYNFGESFPLTLEADFLLHGSADSQITDGEYEKRYSTYMQVAYPLISEAKVNLNGFVGAGFSLNGDTHLYGDGQENFDLVNVGLTASKVVKLGNYSMPVSATTLWNPSLKIARVQLAVTVF
ncbi:hypothetical protein [uncultured Lutibacter sp.]|uniref:hypothetical protein n=1 Tax=uncultured Lutibacter sp. TaxID=437739 RepID=UPI002624DED0|nr:hypothetical protein [uncultured Lutibacter sp.]